MNFIKHWWKYLWIDEYEQLTFKEIVMSLNISEIMTDITNGKLANDDAALKILEAADNQLYPQYKDDVELSHVLEGIGYTFWNNTDLDLQPLENWCKERQISFIK